MRYCVISAIFNTLLLPSEYTLIIKAKINDNLKVGEPHCGTTYFFMGARRQKWNIEICFDRK